ncbi:putative uncharacterized protein [Rhodococcus sp. AW25M09]|uniref:DUF2516 family protein n=1 Tax=Rhodococcus sp. AW25M09 TaxID=1268303 RepID=UPI0002AC6FBB|nr:DUF2516 family protein [Rhodococcus sp. AW25M09]CCQ15094.1 putative uncharacterized protein [Rhodococcus sp. AW25M09]
MIASSFSQTIFLILQIISIAGAAFAIFHALRQRQDAFPAAGKLTKPAWLGILAVGLLLMLIGPMVIMFWIIGIVAIAVYLVDVRPKIDSIQRGPRW